MDTTSNLSSTAQRVRPERRSRARRTLTCENCRIRKVPGPSYLFAHVDGKNGPNLQLQTRCDGTQPSCKTCEVYHDECRYEKPPPMSQIISMANRLQEAEQTILQLKKELERESSPLYNQTALVNPTASSEHEVQPRHSENIDQHRVHILSNEPSSEELLSDLSLDEHGKVSLNII